MQGRVGVWRRVICGGRVCVDERVGVGEVMECVEEGGEWCYLLREGKGRLRGGYDM